VLTSNDEFKVKAVRDVLEGRLVKRGVPLKALTFGPMEKALGGTTRQAITLQKGIPSEKAREIVKIIKGSKLKVQAAIRGDQVRISGKNKDDLQSVMRMLKDTDLGIDMQFTNYRWERRGHGGSPRRARGRGPEGDRPAHRGRPGPGRAAVRGAGPLRRPHGGGDRPLHPRGRGQAHPPRAAAAGLPAVRLPRGPRGAP